MKKILGIFAASAAALSSAMIAATPAQAQSAILPVEVEVTPAIFLRTYSDLKFVVSPQDLRGGRSVDQDAGSYNEKSGIIPLVTTAPSGTATDTVTKNIPRLYQVWGNNVTADNIQVVASKPTLTSGQVGFNNAPETVTMTVTKGPLTAVPLQTGGGYQEGSAKLDFKFANPNITSGVKYTGGEVTIRVTNP